MENFQIIDLPAFSDQRGSFIKTFHQTNFRLIGINFQLQESYYSISSKDVIRGMHFQLPPHQHSKIVYCSFGAILDVIVDIRKASPDFGKSFSQVLSAENHKAFYIPEGFAHGFKALTEGAVTNYLVSSEYNQASDTGIAFDSFNFDWQCTQPIMSERDKNFPRLSQFDSPF